MEKKFIKKGTTPEKKVVPKSSTPLKNNDSHLQYGGTSTAKDDVPLLSDVFPPKSKLSKVCDIFLSLTIEPVIFSFMFAFMMNMTVLSNMIMEKGCIYYYNFSQEVCQNLSSHPNEKKTVEMLANNFSLYSSLTNLVGAAAMVFIAPWSDKYGRKLPLILAFFGSILTDVGFLLCTYHFDSKLEYLIISRIPGELLGGFICVLTIVFSHASEVSSQKNRTLKYTCIEIAFGFGLAFGSLTAGYVYKHYGYFYVYVTATAMHLFCAPWTLFCVQETTGLDSKLSWKEKLQDLFNCESLIKSITTSFKKREGYFRALVLMIFVSMCCYVLTYEAYGSIGYIYVHHIYNWDPSMYSRVNTIAQVSQLLFTLIFVPLLVGVFKAKDSVLGIIGTLSMFAKNLLFAFAKHHEYIYYLGLLSGFVSSLPTLAMRSLLSKIVTKEELGRVFSFLATCEAIMPTLGTIAVTKLFNATIDVYPNICYLVSLVYLLIPLITFILAVKITKAKFPVDQGIGTGAINEKA